MPEGAKPIARPNLRSLSDLELVDLQLHNNDWYVRQARLLLHSRSHAGKLDQAAVHAKLNAMLASDELTTPKRLRALWSLYVTDGLNQSRLNRLLADQDAHIRAWCIQFLCDESSINSFQVAAKAKQPVVTRQTLEQFTKLANEDESPIVRLYLASAVGRLPFADRWPILQGLASHAEDIDDNNLPRMAWFGLEPMVPDHPKEALALAVQGQMPRLQEFVARRMLSGDKVVNLEPTKKNRPKAEWQTLVQKVAPGFKVRNVGEGGVVHHRTFRNAAAVQTHPLDRKTPSSLVRMLDVPTSKQTTLKLRVSHHPHGDWQLRVVAAGEVLTNQAVGSKTVAKDEWLNVDVDLSRFAGQKIQLSIENHPTQWHCEWAYWNRVEIISE